jgi:uncharacterized protein YkwD
MGKGAVTWLALGASILVLLAVAPSALASPRADGSAAPVAATSRGIDGQAATATEALSAVQASGEILATVSLNTSERRVLRLINNARAARGLRRLHARASLIRAARAHSSSMLRLGYFSHSSASGETYAHRIRRYGYSGTGCSSWSVGEVIGWGAGSTAGSARAVFRAWMRSAGHRAVILTRRWRDVGIGRALGNYLGIGDVRMFTVDFGRRIY